MSIDFNSINKQNAGIGSGSLSGFVSMVNAKCGSIFNGSANTNLNKGNSSTSDNIYSYLGADFSNSGSNQSNYNETYQSGQYMSPESMKNIAKNIANGKVNSIQDPKQLGLNREQADNAEIITRVVVEECNKNGKNSTETAQAVKIALATAMQESTLKNLNYGDRDSKGLFQQRPSSGWGSAQQVQDPVYSTRKFVQALLKTNYMNKSLTHAAQDVQRSAFPDAYAKHESKSERMVEALLV